MLRAAEGPVAIVIDLDVARAPGQRDGRVRGLDEVHHGTQALRPSIDGTKRRARPVLGLDQLGHFPATDQPVVRRGQFRLGSHESHSLLVGWKSLRHPWGAQLVEDASCYRLPRPGQRGPAEDATNSSACYAKIQGFRGVIWPVVWGKNLGFSSENSNSAS